jgi:hypothetical protein
LGQHHTDLTPLVSHPIPHFLPFARICLGPMLGAKYSIIGFGDIIGIWYAKRINCAHIICNSPYYGTFASLVRFCASKTFDSTCGLAWRRFKILQRGKCTQNTGCQDPEYRNQYQRLPRGRAYCCYQQMLSPPSLPPLVGGVSLVRTS